MGASPPLTFSAETRALLERCAAVARTVASTSARACAAVAEQRLQSAQRDGNLPSEASINSGAKCILVVDDEFTFRQMICELLEKNGYRTVAAAQGREALEAVKSNRLDLMLADVMMPGMSGYELVHLMRKLPASAGLPIILMSSIDPALHPRGKWNGVLRKPFGTEVLLKIVSDLTRPDAGLVRKDSA